MACTVIGLLTWRRIVTPMTVAHTVAMVAEEEMGVGHLVSKSLLLVAMPTASVESFHVPLPSCSSATVLTSTPAISADRYTCTYNPAHCSSCHLATIYMYLYCTSCRPCSLICQSYLELLIPHSVQLSAAQEADLRAALAKPMPWALCTHS